MRSAFGVDHGDIEKSFVPKHIGARGGRHIKATALTSAEKAAMKTNLSRKKRFRAITGNERKLP